MKNNTKGFTLIELLVVLVILGLLAGLMTPKVIEWLDNGRHRTAGLQIKRIVGEIDRFYLDVGRYPEKLTELHERPSNADFWTGPYVEAEDLKDPWGREINYRIPGDDRDYDLWSWGKDGQEGGKDYNADLRNGR